MKLLDENLLLQKKEYDKLINERDTIGNLSYTIVGIILLLLYCMIWYVPLYVFTCVYMTIVNIYGNLQYSLYDMYT